MCNHWLCEYAGARSCAFEISQREGIGWRGPSEISDAQLEGLDEQYFKLNPDYRASFDTKPAKKLVEDIQRALAELDSASAETGRALLEREYGSQPDPKRKGLKRVVALRRADTAAEAAAKIRSLGPEVVLALVDELTKAS